MSEFSIADLPVVDDLNVPVSAEEYVDQANPAPPKPGNYRLVVVKAAPRVNKEGKLVLADDKYPTIVIEQAKIVEPVENERAFGAFTDVRTKPFERKNASGGAVPASDLQDLLRGFDETTNFEGFEHMKQLLQQHLDQNTPLLAQLAWTGYDKDYVEGEFAKAGGKDNVSKEVANAIYAKARKSTKDFIVNGVLQQSIVGPSGNTVEAKVKISRFFPSGTELGKGKDARARARIELGPFKAGQTK